MASDPVLPSFDNVRTATPTDLARIATVAAAGFFWSPSFQFQRPRHADFPEDTLSSYWAEYHDAMRDPSVVILVVEDLWNPNEGEYMYKALRKSPKYKVDTDTQAKVVVGVCSINLKPGSSYKGRFQAGSHVESPECWPVGELNRDQDVEAVKLYAEATRPAKTKHLAGQMRLSTLAVHPAYWRRGHAMRLVNWTISLADLDDAPVGVSATPMGATVAAKAGFEEKETVKIKRLARKNAPHAQDSPAAGDVELWIAIRQPARSISDTSTTCSDSPTTDSQ